MLKEIFRNLKSKSAIQRQQFNEIVGIGTIPPRKKIDLVVNRKLRSNWIKHLPSEIIQLAPSTITHLPDSDEYLYGKNCEEYALGTYGLLGRLSQFLPEIETPVQGDFILYCEKLKDGESERHIGIYQSDGSVISRWGDYGPVFRHPLHYVPTDYGDIIHFLRASEEQINNLPKWPEHGFT